MLPPPALIRTLLPRDSMGHYWQMAEWHNQEWHMIRYGGTWERVLVVENGVIVETKNPGFIVPGFG